MRFLLLALIIALAVAWLLRMAKPTSKPMSSKAPAEGEPMVCCAHCGIHFPESEAVTGSSGAVFCSEQHRRLHQPD